MCPERVQIRQEIRRPHAQVDVDDVVEAGNPLPPLLDGRLERIQARQEVDVTFARYALAEEGEAGGVGGNMKKSARVSERSR